MMSTRPPDPAAPATGVGRRWWILGVAVALLVGVVVGTTTYRTFFASKASDNITIETGVPPTSVTPTMAVAATIRVGKSPEGIAIDPARHTLYTANNDDNTVSVIDTGTEAVTATVPVGKMPRRLAVDPDSHIVYVTNTAERTVSAIDGTTRTVIATIPVQNVPYGIAVDPKAHSVYVAAGDVVVIDTLTRTLGATIPIPVSKTPFNVAVDSAAHTLYVTDVMGTGALMVIDTASRAIRKRLLVGHEPSGVALNPGAHTIYAATASAAGTVLAVCDTRSNSTVGIPVGGRGSDVPVFDPDSGTIYTTTGDAVAVIDPRAQKVTAKIPVGSSPHGPVLDSNTNALYTTNWMDGTVSVIKLKP